MSNQFSKLHCIFPMLLACFSHRISALDFYQPNQINHVSVKPMVYDQLIISVAPMLETVYGLAGAKVVEKDNMIILSMVRCHIKQSCDVDISAEVDVDNPGYYNMVIPINNRVVQIAYGDELRQIWPEN